MIDCTTSWGWLIATYLFLGWVVVAPASSLPIVVY